MVVRSGNARGILAESKGGYESLGGGGRGGRRGWAIAGPACVVLCLSDLLTFLVGKSKTDEHRDGILKETDRGRERDTEGGRNHTYTRLMYT